MKVVSLLDSDGDNTISKKEFVHILDNQDAVRCQDVGVDVIGLVDFADFIFEDDTVCVAAEDNALHLPFSRFMEIVLQLRGSNNSTVKDIVDLRKFMRNALIETNRQLSAINEMVSATRKSCDTLVRSSATCGQPEVGNPMLWSADKSDNLGGIFSPGSPSPCATPKVPNGGKIDYWSVYGVFPSYAVEDCGGPQALLSAPTAELLSHVSGALIESLSPSWASGGH